MTEEQLEFISKLEIAISKVNHSRYFESERGYQGALIAALQHEMSEFIWDEAIIEQEYQKRIREHGIRIRPDIIIHVPFNPDSTNTRGDGNFVVFELKLNATESSAVTDYQNLSMMCDELNYPLAIFMNLNGSETYLNNYQGRNRNKIIAYSIKLVDGTVQFEKELPH